ncbi:MAG: Uma2 family endonuclease [Candidatus Latescibacterota bacterium]
MKRVQQQGETSSTLHISQKLTIFILRSTRPYIRPKEATMAITEIQTEKMPPDHIMSFEEYMAWGDEDVRSELVGGKVLIMSPISFKHQEIVSFLTAIFRIYTEVTHTGHILTAPFAMRIGDKTVREPDLLFVCKTNEYRLTNTYLNGPADMVIEIISPESIGRDRGVKFVEYESAGVPEYWLIDPIRQQVEFYRLNGSHYQLINPTDGIYKTDLLPSFFIQTNWFWQDPLPPILDTLKQLKLL